MDTRPNIILINCDDLGWGDPSCYGHPRHSTPHLDQMAAEGVRFTDFYMASPVCSPSRGAMLTGCYPSRIGFGQFEGNWVLFPGQPVGLNPSETTIASALKRAGYRTRHVGKWHCGDQPEFLPTRHGFDGYFGIPYSNDMGRQVSKQEPGKPLRNAPPLPLLLDEEPIEVQPDQAGLTARYVDDAIRFIREKDDRPFFLYFAHMYVHLPIYVQERFLKESKNGPYGAAVAAIDWAAGMLFAELRRLGIDENTLVIFTSDNGSRNDFGDSNGPLRGKKGTNWEGGQRVPCIMRMPGTLPAGREVAAHAAAIDFLPTLAGLAGVDLNPEVPIDGRDLWPLAVGNTDEAPRDAFAYYKLDNLCAVRNKRYKLHVHREGEAVRELYDLQEDIGETKNISDDNPDVVARLESLAEAIRQEVGDEVTGVAGHRRPLGRVPVGRRLTEFDPTHPYYAAEYDLGDRG